MKRDDNERRREVKEEGIVLSVNQLIEEGTIKATKNERKIKSILFLMIRERE